MTPRQIIVPATAYPRISERLDALGHDLEVLLWSSDAVRRLDGTTVDAPAPEAAWLAVDLFLSGELATMADALVDYRSVSWVQGCLAGVDAPPFQKIRAAGIRLSNSDAPNIGVAEYVMSSMMAVVHGLTQRIDNHRSRTWAQTQWDEIGGMQWLIVGFGSIGREIARRARPFGVEITGLRRSTVADEDADRMATLDQLHDELGRADAVILACPLTDETRGLANEAFFAAMKPGSIVVNVSRGAVVDTPGLLTALDAGTPGTAILDVFDTEPLPVESPLWAHPSIFFTSHVAGAGRGVGPRSDALFVEQLADYLDGTPLRLEV